MTTDTKPAGNWARASVERATKRASRTKGWALNGRLLLKTAFLLVVAVPLAYFWHGYQVARNASALLVLADGCEARGEWMQAAEGLHRYLQLRPSDVEAIVRMAEDFCKGGQAPMQKARAVQLYARAIALSPGREDLQHRQMTLRLEAGDHGAARKQAEQLLSNAPDDPEALRVRALAMHQQWRLKRSATSEDLLAAFLVAIDKNISDTDLATSLAQFYRSELQPTKTQGRAELERLADDVMDRLVAKSDREPKAYVARYVYRRQIAQQANSQLDASAADELRAAANADLDRALVVDDEKQNFVAWWLAGMRSLTAGDYAPAVEYFDDAITIDANDRRGYVGLGNAYSGQGNDDKAIETWRKASPGDIELELLIAAAEVRKERWQQAEVDLQRLEKKLGSLTGPQHADWLGSVYLLRGEAAIGRKEFRAAIGPLKQSLALRQAGAQSLSRATVVAGVLTRLGQCYAAVKQWDQAAITYQRAANLLPRRPGPRLAAAAAWEASGRYDDAVRQYEDALLLEGVGGVVRVAIANAECLRQLSLPRSQRDWQTLGGHLAKARGELAKDISPPPLLGIVESEYDAEQGHAERAVDRCRQLEQQVMTNKELVRRLTFDYERWQLGGDADRLLEQFRQAVDDPVAYALLASELQLSRGRHDEAYRLLTDALPSTDDGSRGVLEYRLAVMHLADGTGEQAKPLLERLAEADKNDLRPLQFLAELALQAGQVDKPVSYNSELESREGAEGTNWRYYKAQRLMLQANEIGKSDRAAAGKLYQQAAELQEQIESLRPAWAPGYLLKARLAETRPLKTADGARAYDEGAAIQAYTHAIRLGARSVPVYDALINLLFRQSRMPEADMYLDQLRDLGPLPNELSTIAMAIDVNNGKLDRAVALARERLIADPNDAMRHLRLGILLAREADKGESANKETLAEAEQELGRARNLSPADSRTWAALLTFYKKSEKVDAAQALLTELEETKALGNEATPFFLAQGYSLLDNEKEATDHYRQAIEAAPDRPAVQLQAANHFFKRDPDFAEKCLRRALEIDPANRDAAELLAAILAGRSGTEEEVDRLLTQGEIQPKDRRLYAVLLLRRGGQERRRRAQEILEALAETREAVAIDRVLLARLYEAQAALAVARGESRAAELNLAAARDQLKALVNTEHPAPEHLVAYIDNLLRSGRVADAAGRLDELAKLEPETMSARTLSLRLRCLKDQQDERPIRPLIDAYVDNRLKAIADKPGQARVLQVAAELYAAYDLPEEAERAFRRASGLDAAAASALVNWLSKENRTSEAVQLCVELAQHDPTSRPAILLSHALAIGKPSEDDLRAADPILGRALQEYGDDPNLLFSMSIRLLMDGNNDEAIRLLRKVVKLQPRHAPAMNNLAFLLSMRPDGHDEATEWMAKALAFAGSTAELVDSKGWVLMQQQKLTEAVDAFQEALTDAPTDPRYHFHLALAYQLQGKRKEAQDALQIARQSGIESMTMPPDELSALARLETALQ